MIREENGRRVLQYETNAIVRRIPVEKRGVSTTGKEWLLGTLIVEAFDDNESESVELMLTTFDEEVYEQVVRIGVGKKVRVTFHIDTWQRNGRYSVSCILDAINGFTEGEDFLYRTNKKGE